jgi:hypothetical protein
VRRQFFFTALMVVALGVRAQVSTPERQERSTSPPKEATQVSPQKKSQGNPQQGAPDAVNQSPGSIPPAQTNFWSPQVYQGIITALGTILSTLIIIRVAQRFQVQEGSSRAELSLNRDIFTRCIRVRSNLAASGGKLILETRVEIKNNSRRTCCIPAVYVSARALSAGEYAAETDFYNLPECDTMSEVTNVARIAGSIIQLAPDEIARFVRWNTLDQDFVDRFPVIVLNVEAFAAELKHLGEWHYGRPWWAVVASWTGVPFSNQGKYRRGWLEFMESEAGVRNTYVVFSRWLPSTEPRGDPLRPFQRYLLSPDGKPDLPNCNRFATVLSSVVRWSGHVTVILDPSPAGKVPER